MANVLVEESSLQDIADAIREKTGTSDTYTPAQMGERVRSISSGGSSSSWTDISAAFLTINPDVDYILALTNGTFVFLTFSMGRDGSQITIPTGYECSFSNGYVYGSGFSQETGEPANIVALGNTIQDIYFLARAEGTIIYPIA